MQDSSLKTSKIGNKTNDKCLMAHGSSKSFPSSDESEGSNLSEKSRKSQKSGKSDSDPFDRSISDIDSENDISYDELIECYEQMCKQFKKVKSQNRKLKEELEKNEMRIDNAQAFYEENEKLKVDIEELKEEVINCENRCECIQEKHQDTSAKDQEKHFKWSCVDSQEVPCRQIHSSRTNKLLEAQMEQ
ncbi:hypothetical protein Taro_027561 [Colocasia esculenta]|uniref:Uncharacterized protein n=1 Tax=Colocasia esculenta TaxID=4460 RepID=A0A843VUN2_COLES|nr:hypothetical protein [Colocasia esculenta]